MSPLIFDLEKSRQEERRTRLAKAFSQLFRRHRKSYLHIQKDCDAQTFSSLHSFLSSTSESAKSSEEINKSIGSTAFTPLGDGEPILESRQQLDVFGRSFRRIFGISSASSSNEKISNTTTDIKQDSYVLGALPEKPVEDEVSMIPIQAVERLDVKTTETEALTSSVKIVTGQNLKPFQKLLPPVSWKLDQERMQNGDFVFPKGFTDRYRLTELIGEGSFGFVWVAISLLDEVEVAVKFIHRERTKQGSDEYKQMDDSSLFKQEGCIPKEVEILQSLQHPAIIRLIDFYPIDEGCSTYAVIVTELFGTSWAFPNPRLDPLKRNCGLRPIDQLLQCSENGKDQNSLKRRAPTDLFECIEAHEALPEPIMYCIFSQLLDASIYLVEEHGILHRDLKDENVVVDEAYRIKLIDFGSAARIPRTGEGEEDLFRHFNGTLAFAAPEIVRGHWYRGTAAEVWTLGILLYTMRFKRSPFPDANSILFATPRELTSDVVPRDDGDRLLRALLKGMLTKNAKSRLKLREILDHPWVTYCKTTHSK